MNSGGDEGFIVHDGLGRPAECRGPVSVLFRDGVMGQYVEAVELVGWEWDGSGSDIMAWRYWDIEIVPTARGLDGDVILLEKTEGRSRR